MRVSEKSEGRASRSGHRGGGWLLACSLLLPANAAAAQEPTPAPAAQNPSPMVENTRAHERIVPRPLAGDSAVFAGPLDKPVTVFLPKAARNARTVSLLIHFHGSSFLPQYAVTRRTGYAVATVQLGSGSGIYDRTFSDPVVFDSLRAGVARSLAALAGRPVGIRQVILSGFSAGHGAIRAILRDSTHFREVAAVLLLDGMHTGYVPPRTVIFEGGRLDSTYMAEWIGFGRAAMAGSKRFLITHSEIFPGTFASTTETADHLLDALGLKRRAALEWGPLGMQLTSRVRHGRFLLMGFAGNSAPDHVDHFHGMFEFLAALERL